MADAAKGAGNALVKEMVETLIASMHAGTAPFQYPWSAERLAALYPHNGATGRAYRGINVFTLLDIAAAKGYKSNGWATFNQGKGIGATVRKGERGTRVALWKSIPKKENGAPVLDAKGKPETFGFCTTYTVFNREQFDGGEWPERETPQPVTLDARVLGIVEKSGADVRHDDMTRAYYSPLADYINVPPLTAYPTPEDAAFTLLHEMAHWTGHSDRLNRENQNRFGDAKYAAEELIATVGTFLTCAMLGVAYSPVQHGAYAKSWSDGDDKKVRNALSDGQAAHDMLMTFA